MSSRVCITSCILARRSTTLTHTHSTELIGEEILDEYDEPLAGAASTFVPEEAQRAVTLAANADKKQKAANVNVGGGRGRAPRNPIALLALRRGAGGVTTRIIPKRSSSLPGATGEIPRLIVPSINNGQEGTGAGMGVGILGGALTAPPTASSTPKNAKGAFKSQIPTERAGGLSSEKRNVAFAQPGSGTGGEDDGDE